MNTYIYSAALEDKIKHPDYKKVTAMYNVCMTKYMEIHPYSCHQVMVLSDDFELAKKNIDEQVSFNEKLVPPGIYYYCNTYDGKFHMRHLMQSPSEEILLEIYSDKHVMLI